MDGSQFDRLTKFMTRGTNRRNAMKTLAVGALGGAGLVSAAGSVAAADAPGEEWVELFESMAAAVKTLDADCATLAQALDQWQTTNAARIAEMQQDVQTWTANQRAAHWTAYGQRTQEAAASIHLALTMCGYKPNSTSPFTEADLNSDHPVATPAASSLEESALFYADQSSQILTNCSGTNQQYCNCGCNPGELFTVANCIVWTGACAVGGPWRTVPCCWAQICVSKYDHDQCVPACEYCLDIK